MSVDRGKLDYLSVDRDKIKPRFRGWVTYGGDYVPGKVLSKKASPRPSEDLVRLEVQLQSSSKKNYQLTLPRCIPSFKSAAEVL